MDEWMMSNRVKIHDLELNTHTFQNRLVLAEMVTRQEVSSIRIPSKSIWALHISHRSPFHLPFSIPFSTSFHHFHWLIHRFNITQGTSAWRTRSSTSFATRRRLFRLEHRKFVLFFSRRVLITIETTKTQPKELEKRRIGQERGEREAEEIKKQGWTFGKEQRSRKKDDSMWSTRGKNIRQRNREWELES